MGREHWTQSVVSDVAASTTDMQSLDVKSSRRVMPMRFNLIQERHFECERPEVGNQSPMKP